MNLLEQPAIQGHVESVRTKIFTLFNQCINDMEKAASSSGLTMRDVGVDVEKFMTVGDSYIIELKMNV